MLVGLITVQLNRAVHFPSNDRILIKSNQTVTLWDSSVLYSMCLGTVC